MSKHSCSKLHCHTVYKYKTFPTRLVQEFPAAVVHSTLVLLRRYVFLHCPSPEETDPPRHSSQAATSPSSSMRRSSATAPPTSTTPQGAPPLWRPLAAAGASQPERTTGKAQGKFQNLSDTRVSLELKPFTPPTAIPSLRIGSKIRQKATIVSCIVVSQHLKLPLWLCRY